MNRAQRRADARTRRRTARTATALGSAAVLASAGAGAAIVLTQSAASANAPIVVDSLTDDGTGFTLREAINQANTDAGQDQITFSVTGTITLTSDLPAIEDALHVNGPGAASLTIDGGGNYRVFSFHRIEAVDGTDEVTDLTVTGGNGLNNPNAGGGAINLWYGSADLLVADVVLDGNSAVDGGAIDLYYAEGDVTISGASITGNVATHQGGGLYVTGGGSADPSALHVTVVDSEISGNTTQCTAMFTNGGGGGIYVDNATLDVIGSTISANTVEYALCGGGGVHAYAAVVSVTDSVISDNTVANMGGGLYFNDSDATVVRSTISGNDATGDGGGGIATFGTGSFSLANSTVANNTAYYYGGGLYLLGESSTIVQSTISGNTAAQAGGVYVGESAGTAILLSTITGNDALEPTELPEVDGIQVGGGAVVPAERRAHREDRVGTRDAGEGHHARSARPTDDPIPAGTIELIGTIVAGNGTLDLSSIHLEQVTVESLGSILGTVRAATVTVHDHGGTQTGVTTAALALGPLADNGGPTPTHALLPGSVAIDAGPAATDLPSFDGSGYDQRGEPYARIANGRVDVGAFEVQVESPPEPTFTG